MSKTRDTGFLGNVIKVDASGNVSFVSGSTTLATINTSGQLSGSSPVLSSSYASNAETLDGLDSTVFTLTSSFNAQTASFTAFSSSINSFSASILSYTASQNITNGTFTTTSSFNAQTASFTAFTSSINAFSASILTFTGSASTRLGALESYTSSLNNKTSSFATTGSNNFIGTQTITGSVLQSGSFTSTGTLTAQTLVVQTITSSVVYSSGSNIFGNAIANTQTFTGSVLITGSLTIAAGGNASAPTIFGSTIACSPIGCFATSCATSFIGGTMSGTTIYGSTAVCSPVGKFTTCLDLGGALTGTSGTFSGIVAINGATNSGGLSVKTVSSVGLNIQGTAASALMTFTPVSYDEYRIGAGDVNVNDFGIRNATRAVTYLSFSGGASGGASIFSSTITGTTLYGSTAVCSAFGYFSGCVGVGISPQSILETFGASPVVTITDSNAFSNLVARTSGIEFKAFNPSGNITQQSAGIYGVITPETGYTPNQGYLSFYTRLQGGSYTEKMRITSGGCVGIGTTTTYSTLTVGSGDSTAVISPGGSNTHLTLASLGASGAIRFYTIGGGTGVLATTESMRVAVGGNVGIGASSPAAKLHTCTAYGSSNIQAIFGNSNYSINSIVYDTVIIQADDVTTLKLVERNSGGVDQVLTISTGDNSSRISTTCANPLQFFVAGSPSACGYNGLSGINALTITCAGTVQMGMMGLNTDKDYTRYGASTKVVDNAAVNLATMFPNVTIASALVGLKITAYAYSGGNQGTFEWLAVRAYNVDTWTTCLIGSATTGITPTISFCGTNAAPTVTISSASYITAKYEIFSR